MTDKLAEELFGDARHPTPNLKPDFAARPPPHGIQLLPSDIPIAPAPAPRQQNEDQQRASHIQGSRHEGYYPTHHPTAYSEAHSGYYGPSERAPPNWNMGPGLGWYPPGPGSALAVHPSAPGAPMGGLGHYPGYWPHGPPFPNPYGHYPQPSAPPIHRPEDNPPREHGDPM